MHTLALVAHAGVSDAASWAALLSELPDLAQDIRTAVQEGSAPPWPGAVGTQLPPPGGKQQSAEQQRGQAAPSTAVAAPSASSSAPSSLNGAKPAAPASSSSASSAGTVTAPGTGQSFSKGTAFFSSSAPSSSSLPFNPSFAPMEGEEPMPLDALDAYYMSAGQEGDASDRAGGSVPPKTAVNVSWVGWGSGGALCTCVGQHTAAAPAHACGARRTARRRWRRATWAASSWRRCTPRCCGPASTPPSGAIPGQVHAYG